MLPDTQSVLDARIAAITKAQAQKRAAEAARREQAAAARREARPQRQRQPSARVREAQAQGTDMMNVDSDCEDVLDAGAVEISDAEEYSGSSKQAARKRRRTEKTQPNTGEEEAIDEAMPANLHPDDPANFLKLCRAIRILIKREISDADLEEADALIRQYCSELVKASRVFGFPKFNV